MTSFMEQLFPARLLRVLGSGDYPIGKADNARAPQSLYPRKEDEKINKKVNTNLVKFEEKSLGKIKRA